MKNKITNSIIWVVLIALIINVVPYKIVNASSNKVLSINWNNIAAVGNQPSGSDACGCYALAYSRTILDGRVHTWSEYDANGYNDPYNASADWPGANYISEYSGNQNDVYIKAYNSINEGRPFIVCVKGSRTNQHYVAIVGYTNVSNTNSLNANNFFIIDSCKGTSKSSTENMGAVGYSLKSNSAGTYQYVYTNSGFASSGGNTVSFDSCGSANVSSNSATINSWVSNTGKITEIGYYFGTSISNQSKIIMSKNTVEWTRFNLSYDIKQSYGQLSPGSTYYWCFYVISDGVEYKSSLKSFSTNGATVIAYDSYSVENITDIGAKTGVWFSNSKGKTITSLGFYYGTNMADMKKVETAGNISWTRAYLHYDLSSYIGNNLIPGADYYVRYYITVDGINYYSDYLNFSTTSSITFDTYSVENITDIGAKTGVWFSNSKGKTITSLGFYYGTNMKEMRKVETAGNISWTRAYLHYDLSSYIGSNLIPGTDYYVRYYVTVDGIDYYSDYLDFTTVTATLIPTVKPTDTPTPSETSTPVPSEKATPNPTESALIYELGDVNSDGNINAADALLVLKYVAKISNLTDEQLLVADTSKDENINASDALLILKYAAKIIEYFPFSMECENRI